MLCNYENRLNKRETIAVDDQPLQLTMLKKKDKDNIIYFILL